jgi:hypothetical protein
MTAMPIGGGVHPRDQERVHQTYGALRGDAAVVDELKLDRTFIADLQLGAFARAFAGRTSPGYATRDVEPEGLRIRGKGGVTRIVPLRPELAEQIAARPTGWGFPGKIGGHLSSAHVEKMLKRARAGLHRTHVSPPVRLTRVRRHEGPAGGAGAARPLQAGDDRAVHPGPGRVPDRGPSKAAASVGDPLRLVAPCEVA